MDHTNIRTLGELKASGYQPRTVKDEIRANLIAALERGDDLFPGILGYEQTVLPQIEHAILGRHDFILLGLRGQAKSRLVRSLPQFLDEYVPIVPDSDLNDDPMQPISKAARDAVAEHGDDLEIGWWHRSERYGEKLATPDTSHRGSHRRHRPDQGGAQPAHLRRRGRDPLRHRAAHQPGHLLHQRVARFAAAHPGRPAQHHGGAGHPDPRLQHPLSARRADGVHGQPRGLYQQGQHHHAAQRPHRQPDPDALPVDGRHRRVDHGSGGVAGPGRRPSSAFRTSSARSSSRRRSRHARANTSIRRAAYRLG